MLPAPAISTKNKHLLVIYSIPARGFTAAVSVFMGTPPPKPLICKNVFNRSGAHPGLSWAKPTGKELVLLGTIAGSAMPDIIRMSVGGGSQAVYLSLWSFRIGFREIKNPAREKQAG